jgi:hypothetical protein
MPNPRIFIATPTADGQECAAYGLSMRVLQAFPPCELVIPMSIYDQDLVRVRSRYVADFLESDASHLLYVDADIGWSPDVVRGMLAAGEDYVCAPYRRKCEQTRYPVVLLPGADPTIRENHTTEVGGCGLGMTLLSRAMLERMVEHYWRLTFRDRAKGDRRTVALFQLIIADEELLSEDLSFGRRWRAMGGKIWLYLGPGSPVDHYGSKRYVGTLADFGCPAPDAPAIPTPAGSYPS